MKTNKLALMAAIAMILGAPVVANAGVADLSYGTVTIDGGLSTPTTLTNFSGLTLGSTLLNDGTQVYAAGTLDVQGNDVSGNPNYTDYSVGLLGDQGTINATFTPTPATGVTNIYFNVGVTTSFAGSFNSVSDLAIISAVSPQLLDDQGNALTLVQVNVGGAIEYTYTGLQAGHVYDWQVAFTDPSGNGTFTSNVNVAAVPEPEEWAMLLLGLPLIGWVANRKQSVRG